MKQRLDYQKTAPEAFTKMYALEKYVQGCGLERSLIELVKIRVSQMNGCAYCAEAPLDNDFQRLGLRVVQLGPAVS